MGGRSTRFFLFMVWLLVCTFFLPAPLAVNAAPAPAYTDDNPVNAHIMRRLNSPERLRALEEAARIDAAARDAYAQSEAAASAVPAPREGEAAALPASASRETAAADSSRPQSVTEVLFNYAAGFAGVPGLAPRQGVDGYDEGLGFHQDGTVRRAGGIAGSTGPSGNGQRARTYMQSGLQNGYGLNGYSQGYGGLYDELHYDLWGRNDPTRGGRIGAGNGYSRELGDFDPMGMALDRGLNYGAGFVNSMGEAALSGLVDGGRARLNFQLDKDGYFGGEGDALLPFYDSQYSTAFVQLGGRSMHDESDTRWIGNFGLGQRWFPAATEDDSGNWMVGYNAFFDYDFTRDHQRGGIGIEAQYDWLRLASNYYFPLSGWKGSEDFDSDFVKERAAKGWDVRAKGYLPFYRNVAITGAYSQWYGDHVGMFGASRLEKDPKVWSYGLEYTPVPLVSGFITQKSTERGRTDTEFGLNFTYHFQMPWEDQISHSKVAELRTVSGSRHEFVDRENRIILEYKARDNYHIEFVSRSGNVFTFRIKHAFNEYAAGKTVRVSASGVTQLAEYQAAPQGFFAQAGEFLGSIFSVSTAHAADLYQSYTTDRNGEFRVTITDLVATSTVTIEAGEASRTFTGSELGGGSGGSGSAVAVVLTDNRVNATAVTSADHSGANKVKVTFKDANGDPITSGTVAWTASTTTPVFANQTGPDANGVATAEVSSSVLHTSTITATMNGISATASVDFGPGGNVPALDMATLNTSGYYYNAGSPNAVGYCGGEANLPTIAQLQALSGNGGNGWWNTAGVDNRFYRTQSGSSPFRDFVDMPHGDAVIGDDGLTFDPINLDPLGVVCVSAP